MTCVGVLSSYGTMPCCFLIYQNDVDTMLSNMMDQFEQQKLSRSVRFMGGGGGGDETKNIY